VSGLYSISLVIPLYNEVENVPLLADRVLSVLDELSGDCECLLVDDGSGDGTRAAIEAASAADIRIVGVYHVRNFGQSAAILTGMKRARGEYIVTLDGDLQNDPADIPIIVDMLAEYDCVCGYRTTREDTWIRKLSSRIANRVRNAILHDGLRDTGCGTKGFRRACVSYLIPFNGAHRFFGAVLRNAGMRLAECPVRHHPRRHGESKYGIGNRLGRGLYDLIGVLWLQRRVVYPVVEGEDR